MRWAHLPDAIICLCIELAAPKVLPILALLERRCRAPTRERLAFFVPLMSIPFVIPPVIILGSFYEERFEIMHKLVTARSMSSFAIATAQGALPFLRSLIYLAPRLIETTGVSVPRITAYHWSDGCGQRRVRFKEAIQGL